MLEVWKWVSDRSWKNTALNRRESVEKFFEALVEKLVLKVDSGDTLGLVAVNVRHASRPLRVNRGAGCN